MASMTPVKVFGSKQSKAQALLASKLDNPRKAASKKKGR